MNAIALQQINEFGRILGLWCLRSSVYRHEILDRMKLGPWPVGRAHTLFSEQWWLRNAIWQRLGREHGKYRAELGIRINEFGECGPP